MEAEFEDLEVLPPPPPEEILANTGENEYAELDNTYAELVPQPGMEPDDFDPAESKEPCTIEDAKMNAEGLTSLPLMPNDYPDIQAASCALNYEINLDARFVDRGGFNSTHARIQQEVEIQARLAQQLELGEQHSSLLYTWRNCSRAIPVIKSHDQANRMDIYEQTINVLGPYVEQLKQFYVFECKAIEEFCEDTKRLCPDGRLSEFVSEGLLLTMGRFLNMLAILDELKNSKASIKNDFSAYRRALEISRQLSAEERQKTQELSLFLGTHNSVRLELKTQLAKTPGREDLLCDIINACLNAYELEYYLSPTEKHSLIKAMTFGIYLLDSTNVNVYKLDNKRKINISRIDKILKHLEVVPLFGDMVIPPFNYIQSTPNYDEGKWGQSSSEHSCRQMELIPAIPQIRAQHDRLLCDIALCPGLSQNSIFAENDTSSPDESREVYRMALRALQALTSWTSTAVELVSWKLNHPTDYLDNQKCPRDAEEYERATKYNFNAEEKCALVELISMIKGLQATLKRLEIPIRRATRHYVYVQMQSFLQLNLREPLRRAAKKNKEIVLRILLAIRDICGDWDKGVNPAEDPILKGKKDTESGYTLQIANKTAVPSATQLYLFRTLLEVLIEKTGSKKSLRKELDSQQIAAIENFLKTSFFWPHMINFSEYLYSCADLSQLWYREFYLEMAQGKRMQFPITMSIPWILTNHILETKDPARMDCILYLLDLYNDSARCAMKQFRKQYLFDEIEAEVNLCFDQLVYSLSNDVFAYYKHLAACIYIDKRFRNVCKQLGVQIQPPKAARYQNLLRQRGVKLLGRNINLQKLISQRIDEAILKSLETAITRFDSAELTGIMELEGLLELNRLTHRLLSEHLPLADFGGLLREANHDVNTPCGRITQHVILELLDDFLPHFCYNNTTTRFVRTKLPFAELPTREKAPNPSHAYLWGSKLLATSFSAIYGLYSQFVGPPHFNTLCRIMQYQDIAVVLKQMKKFISTLLTNSVIPYVEVLMRVMPSRIKLPLYDYGSSGVFLFYQAQLVDILNYSDLQPKMFQSLRELGNALIFCLMLTQGLSQHEVNELTLAAMFQNVIPKPFVPNKAGDQELSKEERDTETKKAIKKLESKYRHVRLVPVISQYGNEQQSEFAQECMVLTREKLCCGLSIIEFILNEVKGMLSQEVWYGPCPENGIRAVAESWEFHRLWSALQFVFCIPPRSQHEYTVEQLFGEGLNWAGCMLVSLLGQENRFENMDFCYHLLRVSKVDNKDVVIKGVDIKKMMVRIRKFQILNNQIFAILTKYKSGVSDQEPSVMHIEPPNATSDETSKNEEDVGKQSSDKSESDDTQTETDRTSSVPYDPRCSQFSMFSLDDEEFTNDEPVQTEA